MRIYIYIYIYILWSFSLSFVCEVYKPPDESLSKGETAVTVGYASMHHIVENRVSCVILTCFFSILGGENNYLTFYIEYTQKNHKSF